LIGLVESDNYLDRHRDIGSTLVTGIGAVVYKELKDALGIETGDIYA
jgi:hypothetical protein